MRLGVWVGLLVLLASAAAAAEPERREWAVDGTNREALIYAPPQALSNAVPAVFVVAQRPSGQPVSVLGRIVARTDDRDRLWAENRINGILHELSL